MRERREETAEGDIGGRVVDAAPSGCGWDFVEGLSDASIDCCEGSRREKSIWLGEEFLGYRSVFGRSEEPVPFSLIRGIAGCLESALRACRSF
jgi:hypothetical protein